MLSLKQLKTDIANVVSFKRRLDMFRLFFNELIKHDQRETKDDAPNKKNIAVIIQPWMFSAVPFYILTIGLFLKRKHNVSFVLDSFTFGRQKLLFKIQVYGIKKVLNFLNPALVIDLKKCKPVTKGNLSDSVIEQMAGRSSVHFMKGELKIEGRAEYKKLVYDQLTAAEPYIHAMFIDNAYDCVFFPGGIYGTSCLYYEFCKKYNVRPNTFDSDFGVLITSVNGIAAQLSDIPIAYRRIKKELNADVFDHIYQIVHDQVDKRTNGKDHFNTQIVSQKAQTHPDNIDCLMVLNVSWDSAALGINTVFDSYYEWVLHTVEHVLNNSDNNITIRQHPHERFPLVKSNDDFEALLKAKFGDHERIQFIDCNDNVNTYKLITKAKFVLAFSSTAGVEAVILGKPVIIASGCYYSDLGFVNKAESLKHYNNLLDQGLSDQLSVNKDQIDDAYICYYAGICCNLVFTDFTPVTTDFIKWVKRTPSQVYAEPAIQRYLESICSGVPLAYLNFNEEIKAMAI